MPEETAAKDMSAWASRVASLRAGMTPSDIVTVSRFHAKHILKLNEYDTLSTSIGSAFVSFSANRICPMTTDNRDNLILERELVESVWSKISRAEQIAALRYVVDNAYTPTNYTIPDEYKDELTNG